MARSSERGQRRGDPDRRVVPRRRPSASAPSSSPSLERVDEQEEEQADGERQHEASCAAGPAARMRRIGEEAERHRHDAEEQADERQLAERGAASRAAARATSIVCSKATPVAVRRTMWCVSPSTQG